jgi:hypothetical protein
MHDTVEVQPTQLQEKSPVAHNGASDVANASQLVETAIADLANALVAVDILNGVAGTLETFGKGLAGTLACYATGLTVIGAGLAVAAKAFESLDSELAATFRSLGSQLSFYTGFETNVTMPTVHAVPTAGYTLSVTHLSLHVHEHSSFWGSVGHAFSSAWDATGGQVVHFVAEHGKQIAIVAGVTVCIVAIVGVGILLTVPSGGTSDVAAGAGTTALLTAAAAAL